jgi:ribonuclease HII
MTTRIDPSLIPAAPNLDIELALWEANLPYLAGIDEAGRGALAGPVVTAATILPPDPSIIHSLEGVQDSKQLTPLQRESWSIELPHLVLSFGIGFASSKEIDRYGIIPATQLAAERALSSLSLWPQHLLLDYLFLPNIDIPQTSLIKGDARSLSIAVASIIAKTTRDAWMCELDSIYPSYGFSYHKGYCTARHVEALEHWGPSPFHRRTFRPVTKLENPSPDK